MIRYNTNASKFEVYSSGVWASLDTAVGASGAFENNGNAFGAPALLGTTDNNPLSFETDRKTTRLISSHEIVSNAAFCLLNVRKSGYVGISQLAPQSSFDRNATDAIIVPR